jgi:hypothetical protein
LDTKVFSKQKQEGVAIFIFDKIDFKQKFIRRDKDGHLMLIKGIIPARGNSNC